MRRKKFIIIFVAIILFSGFAMALNICLDQTSPVLPASAKAPNVQLTMLDGRQSNLHDFSGRVILLNFWASWCAPCVAELPHLLALARAMPDDITVVAVSVDNRREDVELFLQKNAPDYKNIKNFHVAWDAGGQISGDIFGTFQYPETIITDSGFIMRDKISGGTPWDSAEMKKRLLAFRSSSLKP